MMSGEEVNNEAIRLPEQDDGQSSQDASNILMSGRPSEHIASHARAFDNVGDSDEELRMTIRELRRAYQMADGSGALNLESFVLVENNEGHELGQQQPQHFPPLNRPLLHPLEQEQPHAALISRATRRRREFDQQETNNDTAPNEEDMESVEGEQEDSSSQRSSLLASESDNNENEGSSDDGEDEPEDNGTEEAAQRIREEQEAYRKMLVDKEVFHLLHKFHTNDPTATSLSLLPEADRVLTSRDWDTSPLLSRHRILSKRTLMCHVSRQRESQQHDSSIPTGAELLTQALANPPLFLTDLQLFCPLVANRLDSTGKHVLANFLATSTSLREFTLFHTSPRPSAVFLENNENDSSTVPTLISALARNGRIQKLALRKLNVPRETDFVSLLGKTRSLVNFDLSYCALDVVVSDSLRRGLLKNCSLETLNIRKDLGCFTDSLAPILEGLNGHYSLRELELEIMTCQQSELTYLGNCVWSSPNLGYLSLIVSSAKPPSNQQRADSRSTQLDASHFFEAVSQSKSLKKLRLYPYVTLQDQSGNWRAVLEKSQVHTVDLGQGVVQQANPELISGLRDTILADMHCIRNLNLSNICCHGEVSFSRVLSSISTLRLEKLFLRNCRLMDSDCENMANQLERSTDSSLIELDLGSNSIGFHGLACLAKALRNNPGALESLDLSFNMFGHSSCVRSFAILLKSTKLKNLDVSCTDMFMDHSNCTGAGHQECCDLADDLLSCLAENQALVRLAADDNCFSDSLLVAFCDGVRDNTCLKELSLDGNSLQLTSSESQKSVVDMLASNQTLVVLNIPRSRGMTEEGFRAVSTGLKRNRNVKDLAIRALNVISLQYLQRAIVSSQSLVNLTITLPSSGDRVEAETRVLTLLKCVGKIKTFQKLHISNTEQHLISPSTGKVLLDILRKNPSFQSFNLSLSLCPFDLRVMIEFFVELNKRGRRFLDVSLQQPVGLWPHILARLTQHQIGCARYLFFFLREHVLLHQSSC